MTDKEYIIKLQKENKRLKQENKILKQENKRLKQENNTNSNWDFHYSGKGDYQEEYRCFYGDFS